MKKLLLALACCFGLFVAAMPLAAQSRQPNETHTQISPDKIEELLRKAEQGDAGAQYNLGCCYDKGDGVAQDKAKAVYWYTKAAEQGLAQAQGSLGFCYHNGYGVAEDKLKAVYWYTKAAERGNAKAQEALRMIQQYPATKSKGKAKKASKAKHRK